jgi:hypothetical protein
MKLSIEQHELRALVNNVNEMLPFIEANECEKAIQALLPLLENAIDTKERLENEEDNDIEEKKGKDLLKAILERRDPTKKKIEKKKDKKRNREEVKESEAFESEWDAESEPLWAPYDLEKAPGIPRVDSFNKQRGEFGLFLHARPNWQQQTFAFFANAESLKPIDDLYSKKYRTITAILKRDICNMKKTPQLVEFLKKSEWGESLLKML